jgi:hypothetical protein
LEKKLTGHPLSTVSIMPPTVVRRLYCWLTSEHTSSTYFLGG